MSCMDHGNQEPAKHEVIVNALDILGFSFGWVSGLDSFYEKQRQIVWFSRSSLFAGSRKGATAYRRERMLIQCLIECGTTQN